MTSHSDGVATDGNRAIVAATVATDNDGVGNGAVATVVTGDGAVVTVTNPDDATIATSGNAHKSSFPRTRESRTNKPAQPTEFNAVATGASHPDGATVVTGGGENKIVIPAGRRNPVARTAK